MTREPLGTGPWEGSWSTGDAHMFLLHLHVLPWVGYMWLTTSFVLFCLLSPELRPDHQQPFIRGKPREMGRSSAGMNLQHILWSKSCLQHRLKPWQGEFLRVYMSFVHVALCATWICSSHRPQNISIHQCCSSLIICYDERQINWMWSALISFRADHLWRSYSQTADTCNWSFGWAQCQAESYLWSNSGSQRISALSQGLCMSNRKKKNNNKGKMVVNTKFWIVLRDQAVFRVDHTLSVL